MAEEETLNIRLRVVNEGEVASQIDDLSRDRAVVRGGGSGAPAKGGGGLGQAIATGAATAVFSRLTDALKSLESSVGSAFDASTTNAEKIASILEGLGSTISPAIGNAIKGILGPQVELEQQTVQRSLSQLQAAAEAIALSTPKGGDVNQAIKDRLGNQINAITDIERRRAQGSIALQQILAQRSEGISVGATLDQLGQLEETTGVKIPGLDLLITLMRESTETQKEANEKQAEASDKLLEFLKNNALGPGGFALGAAKLAQTELGDNGGS